ncbi:MAG: cell division protein FtsA [Calditrichaeota bacterium]|nr:cell division protein FtsA [Calditrichota bacterium]
MATAKTLVGIDLGTTKITAIIAEVEDDGEIEIVGVGTVPSTGIKRGVIVGMEKAIDSVQDAVEEAEHMAGVKVREAFVTVASDQIRSLNSRGIVAVARGKNNPRDTVVSDEDIARVLDKAREVALPTDREILHVMPQGFTIDDQSEIPNPIGISGRRLEADVHIITGLVTTTQNIQRVIRNAGISLRKLILQPLASSFAVLTPDEMEIGALMIELGGGTTDITVYMNGSLQHTSIIPLGGINVTRDIAQVLGVSPDMAERLKIDHAAVTPPVGVSERFTIEGDGDFGGRLVDPIELNAVVRARLEEILRLVQVQLKRVECADLISAGIILTGGGAMMSGIKGLAEEIFLRPVRIGHPRNIYGLVDTVHNPAFATAVGLISFALHDPEEATFSPRRQRPRATTGLWSSVRSAFETLLT